MLIDADRWPRLAGQLVVGVAATAFASAVVVMIVAVVRAIVAKIRDWRGWL